MLARWVEAFKKVRVLVVGDWVADHYVYGQTERVSREAPVLIVRHERDEVKLGGAANAAANVRALGAKVQLVGHVGRDAVGTELVKQVRSSGIEANAVKSASPTESKMRVLAGGVSTTRQQMLRIDRGNQGQLTATTRKQLASTVRRALKIADCALVSDYGAGVLCDEVRRELLSYARAGGKLCVDSRFDLKSFRGATVCKPNEPELLALTGLPLGDDASFARAAAAARKILDCDVLLVTRGRRGMAVFDSDGATFIPVYGSEEAVDVTGAGDTVIATFASAYGAGASAIEAAKLANIAGALVVQKLGTATVSARELVEELK